jgi:hypothetical protein
VYKRIKSAVKRVEFVSDRMSYIILRGRCVISHTEDKILKDGFLRGNGRCVR